MERLGSSFRDRSAEDTLAIAERVGARLGITRVTDITRMDRLGLPVFASIRPRGALLQVHAGKGVIPIEARVGAFMEAIEYQVAQPDGSRWDMRVLTVAELDAQLGADVAFVDLVPRLATRIVATQPVRSVACEDIASGRCVWLPAELVFQPFEHGSDPEIFGWTGTGLASGNSLADATLHACLEILERDAIAMNRAADRAKRVEETTLPPIFRDFAAAWHAIGVHLCVREIPNVCRLPCFEACLHEPDSTDINLASGQGLHVDREIALARAICEAAQSRLSGIHGGREDITEFFAKYDEVDADDRKRREQALVDRWFLRGETIRFDETPHEPQRGRSVADVLAWLLKRMDSAGFGTVFRHRFDTELDGLVVVKVVVPRAEGAELLLGRIGARFLARVDSDD